MSGHTQDCDTLTAAIVVMFTAPYGSASWHYGPWSTQLNKSNEDLDCLNADWISWLNGGYDDENVFPFGEPRTAHFQRVWNHCDETTRDCAKNAAWYQT